MILLFDAVIWHAVTTVDTASFNNIIFSIFSNKTKLELHSLVPSAKHKLNDDSSYV